MLLPVLAGTALLLLPTASPLPAAPPTTAYAFRRPATLPRPTSVSASMSPVGQSDATAAADGAGRDPCPAGPSRTLNLFTTTPLLKSAPLSNLLSPRPVYLKLDSLQASGSFKDRGMAHLCQTFHSRGVTQLISSSGGNAGLAVATVAPQLGMTVSVIVPETTKPMVVAKLRRLGADVTVHGANWNEADGLARKLVAESGGKAEYVSPYDHELLWTGHSTLVDEIVDQLDGLGDGKIGTVVASVGGGGLICGILEGLERRGLTADTAVIAAETEGAASFGKSYHSGRAGETTQVPVRLEAIDSVATSLGALEVTPEALSRAQSHVEGGGIVRTALCTDAEAVEACVKFAEDHRVLVEPACGAALAVIYSDRLREEVFGDGMPDGPVVVEVCGGSGVNLELLEGWKKEFLSSP